MVRFGHYDCWSAFATICSDAPPAYASWDVVFVNQDTFTYVERYSSHSIRPPLYAWFARAANLFLVTTREVMEQTRNLIPHEADPAAAIAFLAGNPQPALLRIAQAQQLVLWGSVLFFVWAAARLVPALPVAAAALALYDGGVLTHFYFARAIETKMLYLAALFIASGAALLAMVAPSWRKLLLVAVTCAALPLIRPQGLVAGLMLGAVCLRFVWAQPSIRSASVAAAALAVFVAAAALPSVVTYVGLRVLQPSNIYALSRIAFALELATPDDVAHLPDDLTRSYLTDMLAMRDTGDRPASINASVHRNQGLAMQACVKIGSREMNTLICGNAMGTVAKVVLDRHQAEYWRRIVLPALNTLARDQVGRSLGPLPITFLLAGALVVILAFFAPWVALWGAGILALHVSLLLLLAMLAGPHSVYLITSEPVLLSAIAVMLALAVRRGAGLAHARFATAAGK
jgi:hypothetical protein